MEYFAIVMIALIAVLCIITSKEKVPAECESSTATRPFFRLAVRLERVLREGRMNKKIFSQNDELVVMPGHGPPTTVATERYYNIDITENKKFQNRS